MHNISESIETIGSIIDELRAYPQIMCTRLAAIFSAILRRFCIPGGSPPAAKIRDFIGIVSQIRNRADHWHKCHLLLSTSIAKL